MTRAKVGISIDKKVLTEIDRLVRNGIFPSCSQAFEIAVIERLDRMKHSRLARESAKLDRAEEQALANESYFADVVAPEY
jgi:metal-responsive CopG/Arc/MetJ family transcriptional regulator